MSDGASMDAVSRTMVEKLAFKLYEADPETMEAARVLAREFLAALPAQCLPVEGDRASGNEHFDEWGLTPRRVRDRMERLIEALRFYADPKNWDEAEAGWDVGNRARAALAGIPPTTTEDGAPSLRDSALERDWFRVVRERDAEIQRLQGIWEEAARAALQWRKRAEDLEEDWDALTGDKAAEAAWATMYPDGHRPTIRSIKRALEAARQAAQES